MIDNLEWECTIEKNYAEENMGLRGRFDSGLDWFFERNEAGIVLEDDVIPDPSFFTYATTLLERYRSDHKIFQIGGLNFQNGIPRSGKGGYYFSSYAHSWAFATWRRAWILHDKAMTDWPTSGLSVLKRQFDKDTFSIQYWKFILDKHFLSPNDTWDYPWQFSVWRNNGKCCIPEVNLIKNIGFGPDAIHTKNANDPGMNKQTFTLKNFDEPATTAINRKADRYTLQHIYGVNTNFWKNSKTYQLLIRLKRRFFKQLSL
jgi:hypothetical protein